MAEVTTADIEEHEKEVTFAEEQSNRLQTLKDIGAGEVLFLPRGTCSEVLGEPAIQTAKAFHMAIGETDLRRSTPPSTADSLRFAKPGGEAALQRLRAELCFRPVEAFSDKEIRVYSEMVSGRENTPPRGGRDFPQGSRRV